MLTRKITLFRACIAAGAFFLAADDLPGNKHFCFHIDRIFPENQIEAQRCGFDLERKKEGAETKPSRVSAAAAWSEFLLTQIASPRFVP